MKKIIPIILISSALLLTGCAQRVADFTLASTKNVNLNNGHFVEGPRVIGEDQKIIIIVPLGIPSIKEAADQAIEKDKCAVGLTDVTADSEFFSFLFGYVKYTIEGNLLIDKSKSGCENWK
ncbi:hypothetical protein GLP21_19470 [Photobacterium carnosum]|uniref:hypothetical protein n=1 Tax=Photobacterium carnosum TaxID=2023717 RepID=UPI001E5C5B78|nr:hypothetical protein [Photobacterium carnosum]MCD9516854.1 hypothetical protein [Photobacterium carnosum]MCD9550798.1 hypothetical protein [Photobacterium carnosum]MCF2304689.1 hypothetical protein [Photobacterium carnosum]